MHLRALLAAPDVIHFLFTPEAATLPDHTYIRKPTLHRPPPLPFWVHLQIPAPCAPHLPSTTHSRCHRRLGSGSWSVTSASLSDPSSDLSAPAAPFTPPPPPSLWAPSVAALQICSALHAGPTHTDHFQRLTSLFEVGQQDQVRRCGDTTL